MTILLSLLRQFIQNNDLPVSVTTISTFHFDTSNWLSDCTIWKKKILKLWIGKIFGLLSRQRGKMPCFCEKPWEVIDWQSSRGLSFVPCSCRHFIFMKKNLLVLNCWNRMLTHKDNTFYTMSTKQEDITKIANFNFRYILCMESRLLSEVS